MTQPQPRCTTVQRTHLSELPYSVTWRGIHTETKPFAAFATQTHHRLFERGWIRVNRRERGSLLTVHYDITDIGADVLRAEIERECVK